MRTPIPTDRLVALTLVGALLTGIVSLGLTAPALFLDTGASDGDTATGAALPPDAPTPNPDFTPAVRTAPDYGEHEEYEEGDDDDDDEHEEYEEYDD